MRVSTTLYYAVCGLDAACKYVCVCTRLPMCDACYVALGCVLGRARTCKHIFIFIFISERCLHLRPLTSTASFCSTPSLAGTQQQQQFHLHQQECGSAAAAACVLCVYVCACVRVCPCGTHSLGCCVLGRTRTCKHILQLHI